MKNCMPASLKKKMKDGSELSQLQLKVGAFVWGWVLWLYILFPVHAKGWSEPSNSIASPPDTLSLHLLSSPSQHPTHARHSSRLPICAQQTASKITAPSICAQLSRRKALALYKRCPGVFSLPEPRRSPCCGRHLGRQRGHFWTHSGILGTLPTLGGGASLFELDEFTD